MILITHTLQHRLYEFNTFSAGFNLMQLPVNVSLLTPNLKSVTTLILFFFPCSFGSIMVSLLCICNVQIDLFYKAWVLNGMEKSLTFIMFCVFLLQGWLCVLSYTVFSLFWFHVLLLWCFIGWTSAYSKSDKDCEVLILL